MTSEDKDIGAADRTKATDLTDQAEATSLTDRMKATTADLTERTMGTAADLTERTMGTAADLTERTRTVVVKRMPRREKPVDLSTLPAEAKLLYCRILTHQAKSDHVLDPREISNLYLFASTIGLDADARKVLRREIAAAPPAADDADVGNEDDVSLAARLSDLLDGPERDAVMTMLVKDLLSVSRADGQFTDEERARIEAIAEVIFPENADTVIHETERLLDAEEAFAARKITTSQFVKRTKDSVAAAAGLGIPLAAVELAGAGSGAAALTSSLATLGFGGVLGFSAMATGIGTVVVAGVVAYQGTRYVLRVNERERKKRHEFLVQQVIKNHQQAITDLVDDIRDMNTRIDDYWELSSRNEDRLALMRADLESFELALADLRSSEALAQEEALAREPGTRP
jgi:hypothetical protein